MNKKQKHYLFFKNVMDIVFSFILINAFSVTIWPIVIIINFIVTKGHPFFLPERIGKNGQSFKMIKFRSMKTNCPIIPPYELKNEDIKKYETKFGKFLRKTSIDETPQFINVLIGQMSFIGPRPCAVKDEEILIIARNKQPVNPLLVKPGLTGYAQAFMKRDHNVNIKASYDSKYVQELSFKLDFKILIRSFAVIIHKQ